MSQSKLKQPPKRKYSEEEKALWRKIFLFVEKDILHYDNNQRLQKQAVLRLKGLQNGKVIANNKTKDNGEYPLEVVYGAIVLSKDGYLKFSENKDFKTESNAVAYLCAIAASKLNMVYDAWKTKKHTEEITKKIIYDEKHIGAKYKPKASRYISETSKDLW